MSTRYLWIKGTGDGRPNLQTEHLAVDVNVSQTNGDIFALISGAMLERAANTTIIFSAGTQTWTNMPLALTEFDDGNSYRRRTCSLRNYSQFRLHINVGATPAAANAIFGIQYSVDSGVNWAGLDNGTAATISTLTQAVDVSGSFVTAWATINTAARIDDILLRIVGSGGDGAVDPTFSLAAVEVR